MGARDNFQTVTGVMKAFADQNVWKQAELARHLNIESRTLKKVLTNLQSWGLPLYSEEDHPHVIWSVPKKWFPGGVFFDADDWDVLVQAVLHMPDAARRKKMLARLLNGRIMGNVESGIERLERGIAGLPVTPELQHAILLVQDAVLQERPLHIRYFTASSGRISERLVSPQRLISEPHPRLVAYCHVNEALRWFRLDNIQSAHVDHTHSACKVDIGLINRFVESSPDGYHDGTETEWSFIVQPTASAWVKGNLVSGMRVVEDRAEGLRVTTRGGALVVARFIVSLGGDAIAEQDELVRLVRQLAEGALKAQTRE